MITIMSSSVPVDPENAASLQSAANGFDHVFSNEILLARRVFSSNNDPYHLIGLAVCGFLEAALGMESAMIERASNILVTADELVRKQARESKGKQTTRFPPALEWEVLMADATVLSALMNVFSETYAGYLKCLLALKSAHSKFTKLHKTVFPNGDASTQFEPQGPIEELIVSGTAFGFGVFNLALSILPRKIQRFVSWFGFKYDQKSAIQALEIAAQGKDAHAVFAALVLMLYMSLVLQMTSWQADAESMMEQYRNLVDPISARYPSGNLWTLYRGKLMRLMHEQDQAIAILREGLKPGRVHVFKQADMLLVYELAWTLVGERRYDEAAEMFMKMKELNSWSHATYHFLAAGCCISVGKLDQAQSLLDAIPGLTGKRVAGNRPPTEVFIDSKIAFYKAKQRRYGRSDARFVESIKIGLAEELGIFWNNQAHISSSSAKEHINILLRLTPYPDPCAVPRQSDYSAILDLDNSDEFAVRSLLLGICYHSIGDFNTSRRHLREAHSFHSTVKVSTWVSGISMLELATLDLKQMEAKCAKAKVKAEDWERVLREAEHKLNTALVLSPQSVDLSSRFDSRVSMLKEEIKKKRDMLIVLVDV